MLLPNSLVRLVLDDTGSGGVELVDAVADRAKASRAAAAIRLRDLGLISDQDKRQVLQESAAWRPAKSVKKEGASGGPAGDVLKLRDLSRQYVAGVLDAVYEDRISVTDASYFLEASKLSTVANLEKRLHGGGPLTETYGSPT